jgi:hypothetical protein
VHNCCRICLHTLISAPLLCPVCNQQELQTGRFYYKDGAMYEGQYKVVGLPPPVPAEPAKKGAKKKEEEPPAQPAEPPKPVRHGIGKSAYCRLAAFRPQRLVLLSMLQ